MGFNVNVSMITVLSFYVGPSVLPSHLISTASRSVVPSFALARGGGVYKPSSTSLLLLSSITQPLAFLQNAS
jgi:hypothetical protein